MGFCAHSAAFLVLVIVMMACSSETMPPELGTTPCSGNDCLHDGSVSSFLPAVCPDPGADSSPPYITLAPPDVPTCCANGFEIGNASPGSSYVLSATAMGGARAITVDIDYATYRDADEVVVTAVGASSASTTILDTCKLITSSDGDPTQGLTRPPDDTIRQYHMQVPAGTTQLEFNFAGVVSPMYIRALGLCDFDVATFSKAVSWRAAEAYAVDAGAEPTTDAACE